MLSVGHLTQLYGTYRWGFLCIQVGFDSLPILIWASIRPSAAALTASLLRTRIFLDARDGLRMWLRKQHLLYVFFPTRANICILFPALANFHAGAAASHPHTRAAADGLSEQSIDLWIGFDHLSISESEINFPCSSLGNRPKPVRFVRRSRLRRRLR
jgi:hypothetical protein